MEGFSIREKKKALLKKAILEEMLRQLKTKELNEIHLEDLCNNINTSKVTFFKYFNNKEQVLDYFVCKWLYDRSFEIHRQWFQGEKGLYQVFRSISEEAAIGKKIMIALINYYSKLTKKPEVIDVSPYEYFLFNEAAFQQKVKPLDLCEVFGYYLSGIKYVKPAEYNEIICQLLALMYGVPIQTHIMELEDMYPFYELGIRRIVGAKE